MSTNHLWAIANDYHAGEPIIELIEQYSADAVLVALIQDEVLPSSATVEDVWDLAGDY